MSYWNFIGLIKIEWSHSRDRKLFFIAEARQLSRLSADLLI